MRKIINSTYISIDGVIEGPHLWPSLGRPSDERADQIQTDLALSCDALLMGRHTYDGFAPVWPTRAGDPVSDQLNAMPKYVVSTTLKDPEWNNSTVIDGDVAEAVAELKRDVDGDILVNGSVQLVQTLMEHDLVDEYRLMVFPTILGAGKRLFGETSDAAALRLVDAKPAGETLILIYEPSAKDTGSA
jgi:dihydrofolate reductase